MKMKLTQSFAGIAFVGMSLALSLEVSAAPLTLNAGAQYVADEVLVKLKPAVSIQAGKAAVAALGGVVQTTLNSNWMQVKLGAGQTMAATIAAYGNDPNVEYVQPNYIYHATAFPNDPQYAQSWAFRNSGQTILNALTQPAGSALYTVNNPGVAGNDINIEPAWGHITDCSSVIVAVVDTGVNYNHQDLAANMWTGNAKHGQSFVTSDGVAGDPMDLNGHGTHVAGTIGAVGNNGLGATGLCWKANIMAVRVLDATGGGTTATVISGIDYAVTNGAKVINMSLGGSGSFDQLFSDAITRAQNSDVVVVVAAGNDANNNDAGASTSARYPCNFTHPNLICVAALDQSYALATFSDWGATSVDVGAPGTNILATWAGTNATITDTLDAAAAWTMSPTTGGWGYGTWRSSATATHTMLADPATWPTGKYTANAIDRVYKTFNLGLVDAVSLNYYVGGVVNAGDAFSVASASVAGDPFVGGTVLTSGTINSPTGFVPRSVPIPACGASCTIGFELKSAATSTGAQGPAVTYFSIDTLALNTSSYNTIDGTSMATPVVAGVATMLRAYNPQYTYADVVASIKDSGRPVASLSGKTSSGKAVDAAAALAHINKPAGLTAVVQ